MGEIADSIIDGEFDSISGEYLGKGGGFPRSIYDRNNSNNNLNPKFGIVSYLKKQGVTDGAKQMEIIRGFFDRNTNNESKDSLCSEISKDFGAFIKYLKSLPK